MTAIKYMHHTPGRLRIKGTHFKCQGERARKAMAVLQAMKGVELVQLNGHAGSLTVHYDPELHTQDELLTALEQAGCLQANAGTHAPRTATRKEGLTDMFGKAVLGVLAQRTATKLVAVLL